MTIYDYGRSPKHWLLALDIASRELTFLDPADSAMEVFCWMSANRFDVAFLRTNPVSIVNRDELQSSGMSDCLSDYARELPKEHLHIANYSMNSAFHELKEKPWFVLVDGNEIKGIVTRDDLAKPAAGAFVFAHLITLERTLRRLYGTYTNRPIADEPAPDEPHNDQEAPGQEIKVLSSLLNKVKTVDPLIEELGYSKKQFKKLSNWIVKLRNAIAHSRSLIYDGAKKPSILERFSQIQQLLYHVLQVVEERPQIWDAIGNSIIVDRSNGLCYAGPDAVDITTPSYVINAVNPFEEFESEQANDHRNQMLLRVLKIKTSQIIEVIGSSRCGDWKEDSFLVSDVPESVILNLARQYGQRAVFKLTKDKKLVISTDGQIMSEMSRHE